MKSAKEFYKEHFACEFIEDASTTNRAVLRFAEAYASQFKQTELMDQFKSTDEPYMGWCDVYECENTGVCGGTGWRETGYWTLCTKHSRDEREGKKQPKMKASAIERESKRDKKTGWLIK